MSEGHSLMHLADGRLVSKASLLAYRAIGELFSKRIGDVMVQDHGDWISGQGRRQTNYWTQHDFTVVWSNRSDREVRLRVNDAMPDVLVFDALGNRLEEENRQVILKPKEEEFLGGAARILVRRVV